LEFYHKPNQVYNKPTNTNTTGTVGPPGVAGPHGPEGNVGTVGVSDGQGIQGITGLTGQPGLQGVQGSVGNIILPSLTWLTLPVTNSSTTAASLAPQYTITAQGVVHLRGIAYCSGGGQQPYNNFTLPTGYRPGTIKYLVGTGNASQYSGAVPFNISIGTDGGVSFVYPSYGASSSPIYLVGLEFPVN